MHLSFDSRLKIMAYLKGTKAFKTTPAKVIAIMLDRMIRADQIDAVEDDKGNLLFAWGFWMLTDKALEDYKNFIGPKDINRGKNMVGCFCLNNQLSVSSMLRAARKAMKLFNAKTLTIYTTRDKFLTFHVKQWDNLMRRNRRRVKPDDNSVFDILKGGEECLQQ